MGLERYPVFHSEIEYIMATELSHSNETLQVLYDTKIGSPSRGYIYATVWSRALFPPYIVLPTSTMPIYSSHSLYIYHAGVHQNHAISILGAHKTKSWPTFEAVMAH